MNDINRLKAQQRDKHPGFSSYLECMTRGLFTGLATFALGFSGLHFTQKLLEHRLPYDRTKVGVLISVLVSVTATYKVTSDRTQLCQEQWVESEKDLIKERLDKKALEEHQKQQQ